jgi:DNA processing protein
VANLPTSVFSQESFMSTSLTYWLTAVHAFDLGSRKFRHWLKQCAHIEDLFIAASPELVALGLNEQEISLLRHPPHKQIEQDLTWAEQPFHHLITLDDPAYPALLREIYDPPLVLYLCGDKDVITEKQLGLVGSRSPTPLGLKTATEFAYSLAMAGFVITSGLAIGIDGACHRGALAARGRTIAVAGTGLNHIYPPAHKNLAAEIVASGGAIVSEFPLDTLPKGHHFPRRNRIISGLSLGILVVEAALKSGSLITARLALEQNREVFAIPGSIYSPQAKGCHYLIRQGAKLVETAQDILSEFSLSYPSAAADNAQAIEKNQILSKIEKNLLHLVKDSVTTLDAIILQSALTASEVSSILLTLELHDYIKAVPGGYSRYPEMSS